MLFFDSGCPMFKKALFKQHGIRDCFVRLDRLIEQKPKQPNIQDKEQSTNVIGLNFYCFEGIFDCLSLEDVVAVGQTCNRLLKFAREYFKLTFQSAEVLYGINGMFVKNVKVGDFVEQIKNIVIWFRGMDKFQAKMLVSVEKINLHCVRIVPIDLPATFVDKIKMIELHNCTTSDDFKDSFLSAFKNLERLHIKSRTNTNTNSIIGGNNSWMHEKYPKLKYFGLEMPVHDSQMGDLVIFLSKNTQIISLVISSAIFSANGKEFLKSTIKLAALTGKFMPWATIENDLVKELLIDVSKLGIQKFYEKLTLTFEYCFIDHNVIDQLAILNLTELHIDQSLWIIDKKVLAERLVQLQILAFDYAYSDDIVPFVRLSKKLTSITAKSLGRGKYLRNDILDLIGLSSERHEIGSKLTFFVGECVYVCTKNGIKYDGSLLIELKRIESRLL